jgi:hypothetical protein
MTFAQTKPKTLQNSHQLPTFSTALLYQIDFMLWNVELIKKTLISKIWTSSEIMTAKIRNITGMCGRHGNHICPCWKEVLARNAQRWTARRNEFVVACFQKSTKSSLPEIHINSIRTPGQIWISCMCHYGHIGSKSFKSSWPSVLISNWKILNAPDVLAFVLLILFVYSTEFCCTL